MQKWERQIGIHTAAKKRIWSQNTLKQGRSLVFCFYPGKVWKVFNQIGTAYSSIKRRWSLKTTSTMFVNYTKCRIWIFQFRHFPLLKVTCLVTLFVCKLQDFLKVAKMDNFWHFKLTFVHSKCKRSSLRSPSWMRFFLWFSNTVNDGGGLRVGNCSSYSQVHFFDIYTISSYDSHAL